MNRQTDLVCRRGKRKCDNLYFAQISHMLLLLLESLQCLDRQIKFRYFFDVVLGLSHINKSGTYGLNTRKLLLMCILSFQVVIEGVVGRTYTGDIAIDDVSFSDGCVSVTCKFLLNINLLRIFQYQLGINIQLICNGCHQFVKGCILGIWSLPSVCLVEILHIVEF